MYVQCSVSSSLGVGLTDRCPPPAERAARCAVDAVSLVKCLSRRTGVAGSPLALWLFFHSYTFGPPVAYSWLLCLIPTISSVLCNPGLFKGSTRVSLGHATLVAVLFGSSLLTIIWFFPYVLRYQGPMRFVCVTAVSSGVLIALVLLWLLLRVRPNFWLALAFRWVTWSWLTLYVFPYVAELP